MMINRRRAYGGNSLPQGAVDMGLPSGTLWGQGDIVKDTQGNYSMGMPTDEGCYFSWGNIEGHNTGDGYSFSQGNYELTPGYQLTGTITKDDNLHDAALAHLGHGWHLPTRTQLEELLTYTTRTSATINGVKGTVVTSNLNGNFIFFRGHFSGRDMSSTHKFTGMYCNNGNMFINGLYKYQGFYVRGVFIET